MEPKELYVITRSEEHADYVEKVFTDECKAIAYCLQFKADKNRYQRDVTTIKLTEDEEPILITEDVLKGIGFVYAGLDENDNRIFKYHAYKQNLYFSYIPFTGVAECVHVFGDSNGEEDSETTFYSRCVYHLYGLISAMQMAGINVKKLLKP